MKITEYASDSGILAELGVRIRDTRIAIPMTQKELAEKSGLSIGTVSAIERGKDASFSSLLGVLRVLRLVSNLETLIPEQGIRPSQLAELGKKRERAISAAKAARNKQVHWKWGDEV